MPKIETLYLLHHSHTDIGFTNDQPVVWELQARFIDEALDMVERCAETFPADSTMRWTLETTAPLLYWLRYAGDRDIERLIAADRAGLIEVAAMWANITPLYSVDQLIDSLQPVGRLRAEYGLNIGAAMNSDVNGHNWPLVDALLDAGINGVTMAINHHFGGAPAPRPWPFLWQGPSGRTLPTFNGWHYGRAGDLGLGDASSARFEGFWPLIEDYLASIDYPLPFLLVQGTSLYGDNGGPFLPFAQFARAWNERGRAPRIVLATPRMWWAAVQDFSSKLPVVRGDWTDYWNFGAGSTAREVALDRANHTRLLGADALYAALKGVEANPRWADQAFRRYRAEAWRELGLMGEHTWGADSAIGAPHLDDSRSQINHKLATAYTARSLSQLLERDALADLARHVARESADDLLLFNPLPWARTISGPAALYTLTPRGAADSPTDSRHFQGHFAAPTGIRGDHQLRHLGGNRGKMLPPTEVPAFGYTTVPRAAIIDVESVAPGDAATVENGRYRVEFSRERGGVVSLYDKRLDWEWVDGAAGYPLLGFVHEEVADRENPWPRHLLYRMDWRVNYENLSGWQRGWKAIRTQPERVLAHHVYETALGSVVEQKLEHHAVGSLWIRLFLPHDGDYIECEAEWEMGLDTHPQATYLMFPFNVPGATARLNVGGVAITAGRDQLPGVCRDYFTVQEWIDFASAERGVTVAMPENPLVMLGDFHFGDHQADFRLERAMLLGWVTNNYWETNFQPHQPGLVYARYRLLPYSGPFSEERGHRLGAEATNARPLLQHLGEAPAAPQLPASGSLLQLPELPVMTLQARAAEGGGILLRLLNMSDEQQVAKVGSGLLNIGQAWECDSFDTRQGEIAVSGGTLSLPIAPRRTATILLVSSRAD